MEKKTKSLGQHLPPVRLYLNDIKEIYNIFSTLNKSVQIETEDHILYKPEDLTNLSGSRINNINFNISEPYISLQMSKNAIWLYSSADDFTSKGIFNELKSFLLKRRRKLHILIESPFISGIINGLFIIANMLYLKSILFGIFASVGLILSLIYTKWVFKRTSDWYTIIYLISDRKKLNFFIRKKDEILLTIISSILGAILGGVITYLLAKK